MRDMKAAIDATVAKQGTYVLTFHPGSWIRNDQVVELVDHAVRDRPGKGKVVFLNFREMHQRLTEDFRKCELLPLTQLLRRKVQHAMSPKGVPNRCSNVAV